MLSRKIKDLKDVTAATAELETKIKLQEKELKHQVGELKEVFHPVNILKNTFSNVAETPGVKAILINTAIGIALGYFAKKSSQLINETSLDNLAQNFVQHHLTRFEERNPSSLLSKAITVVRKLTPPDSPIHAFVKYKTV